MQKKPKILVIVGPTASGKSDLAVKLAKQFHGEVISADSRQVYRGLDIGTGKITKKEMRGVRHHLLDVASPIRKYSVARYKQQAQKAVDDILKRKKLPMICGGTGFYIDALVDGIILPEVKPDEKLRKRLARKSADELFSILKKIDLPRASTIDANNSRRLVRAIEIAQALGKVPATKKTARFSPLFIGISVPNVVLRDRIHHRLIKRMHTGMMKEVERLHAEGLSWKRMDELGLEYRYLSRFLERKITKEEMLDTLEHEIIRYAKRQMTWWKRDKRIRWIEIDKTDEAITTVQNFLKEKRRK